MAGNNEEGNGRAERESGEITEEEIWESELDSQEVFDEVTRSGTQETQALQESLAHEGLRVKELTEHAAGCRAGCLRPLVILTAAIATLAISALVLLSLGVFNSDGGSEASGGESTTEIASDRHNPGDEEDSPGQNESFDTEEDSSTVQDEFTPRDGVYEVQNLDFLQGCGPPGVENTLEEIIINVSSDVSSLTASGTETESATIEMSRIESPDNGPTFVGTEGFTGMSFRLIFTSETDIDVHLSYNGTFCMERPAVGAWIRDIGAPDPNGATPSPMPPWLPSSFPVSSGLDLSTTESGTSKTTNFVVEDTSAFDLWANVQEWAGNEGWQFGQRTRFTIEAFRDGERLFVEIIDIGGGNVQLTLTIEEG